MKVLGFLVFLVLSHHGLMQIFRLTTYHRYFLRASSLLILYAVLAGWLMFKLGLGKFLLYQVVLASLWLVFVARQQSRQAELMLQLAGQDSESVRSIATSVEKTKRYYAYSAFVYLGSFCLTYLVGGGNISGLLDFSQDPLVTPFAGWLASRSTTGIIGIASMLYCVVGMIVAMGHLSSGKVGASGPLVTLLATTLLWPVVAITESRYKSLGFFSKLFSRNRPPKRLKEISQHLAVQSSPNTTTREMLLAGPLSPRHQAEEDLLDLCENDSAICEIMQRYGATRETLRELFGRLQITGGAQWVRGHYVSASALAYPHTLEFLLRYFRDIEAIDDTYPWSNVPRKLDHGIS